MSKKAVSLTLSESNLLWLQTLSSRGAARSVSDAVDRLITEARTSAAVGGFMARSVVGTIDLDQSDPGLETADAAIRAMFDESLRRPLVVREPREPFGSGRRKRKRG